MAEVRYVLYSLQTAVADPGGDFTIQNVLRDVLPDRPFEILGLSSQQRVMAAGSHAIQVLKNRGPVVAGFPGANESVNHSVVWLFEAEGTAAATLRFHNDVQFARALDFDANDLLSIHFVWGDQGAGNSAIFELTVYYRER